MPGAWSDKDERQYEHIKESQTERGSSEKRAKEIAARTVTVARASLGAPASRRESCRSWPRSCSKEGQHEDLAEAWNAR
jgi:hypothetical protein